MNIKNFCDNMTKNNFRKLSNDDQMLLYKVALYCVQNNLGIPWKARYIINKFYERYNCSFGMGCKQIEDFDESKPYGEHDYMTMEECVSKCNMPADVLDLMVSKIDPNDKLKYIKANPKYALDKMKQGDFNTIGITYDFSYPITDIDIRLVTKLRLDIEGYDFYIYEFEGRNSNDLIDVDLFYENLKPFAKYGELRKDYRWKDVVVLEELDLSMFPNLTTLRLISAEIYGNKSHYSHNLNIKYPPKLEEIYVFVGGFNYSIPKLPNTVKVIEFFDKCKLDNDRYNDEEYWVHTTHTLDRENNIVVSEEMPEFTYGYFNDLPKSLEILKIDMGIIHIDEIILPKSTLTCILKGYFSFGVLRLNEKLKYLHIDDIQGKNFAYVQLIKNQYGYMEAEEYPFIPYNGDSMKIVVPKPLLDVFQVNNELNRLKNIKINPNDLLHDFNLGIHGRYFRYNKDFLVNTYKIEVIRDCLSNKFLVFVYGTLMKSFYNHGYIRNSIYLGMAETLEPFFITKGKYYPFVSENYTREDSDSDSSSYYEDTEEESESESSFYHEDTEEESSSPIVNEHLKKLTDKINVSKKPIKFVSPSSLCDEEDEIDYDNPKPTKIRGELYLVDEDTLNNLDRLEGFFSNENPKNLYNRKEIDVLNNSEIKKAYIYVSNKKIGKKLIPTGDYRLGVRQVYYYAYGSNMDKERMFNRVDESSVFNWYPATLDGYKMEYNKAAFEEGEGYANITISPNNKVKGILYAINENKIKVLDKYEGFRNENSSENHYNRVKVWVNVGGIMVCSFIYIANPARTRLGLVPSKEYKKHITNGYKFYNKLLNS